MEMEDMATVAREALVTKRKNIIASINANYEASGDLPTPATIRLEKVLATIDKVLYPSRIILDTITNLENELLEQNNYPSNLSLTARAEALEAIREEAE